MSNASYYKWRAKYGGMGASLIALMRAIEDENRRLKKMLAEGNVIFNNALGIGFMILAQLNFAIAPRLPSFWRA